MVPSQTPGTVPVSPEKDPELLALGRQVRELRKVRKLTQEELAHRAGLHWTYISQVERGTRNVGYRVLQKLAIGLGVQPSQIMPRVVP